MNEGLGKKLIRRSLEFIHLPDGRTKHFTYILERNKIISFGWNQAFKTHPMAKKYGMRFLCIHSELHAITNFPYRINTIGNYDLVNVRIRKTGEVCISKPCIFCQKLISDLGITTIFYSTNEGQFIKYDYK